MAHHVLGLLFELVLISSFESNPLAIIQSLVSLAMNGIPWNTALVSWLISPLKSGSCNNLDADFGSWTLDAGFCTIGLHRLDSTSGAAGGLSIGQAISCARATYFMISIDSSQRTSHCIVT
jgi:hypothetical protein